MLGAAAVGAMGSLYLWPLARPGAWISGDSPFYLAGAYVVEQNLRAGVGIWGWAPHDLGGFPVFSLFFPSAFGILAIVATHRAALVPLSTGYKLLSPCHGYAAIVYRPLQVPHSPHR